MIDKKKQKLRIIIEDTGVGMTKTQVANLFTNFTKIMDNRELNKEGVGLGLTISRNIAQALGGDIEVQSMINKGSNFILSLPIAHDPSTAATSGCNEASSHHLDGWKEEDQVSLGTNRVETFDSQAVPG